MGPNFAIITFRDNGPIKTWSDMRAANVHNSRLKPIDHGIEGAPAPQHLIGGRDLVADVRRTLKRAGIDPDNRRKNGVIAYEAVMTASPEFFEEGTEEERAARLEQWVAAQKVFALKRWGAHRVASMVLHLDEKTPHIHVVVVPLEVKSDKRRSDPTELRWALVGRMISGPGKFDQLQDDYAEAMKPFGLSRGVKGSGRKHVPMAVYLAQLAEREAGVEHARIGIARERDDLDRRRGEMEAARINHQRVTAEQMENLREVERRMAEERRRLDVDWAAAEKDRKKRAQEMDRQRGAIASLAAQVERDRRAVAEERQTVARDAAANREFRAQLADFREKLKPIIAHANDFVAKSAGIDPEDLAPRAREAHLAALRTVQAVKPRPAPRVVSNDGFSIAQQAALMAQRGMGCG